MSSTYSPDLRIELIGTGDQAGVWGATTNTNLSTVLENAIAGYTSVSIVAASQALTANYGAADQARYAAIALTTTTGANFSVYAPPASKLYVIYNASSYVATIYNSTVIGNTTAAGTGVAVPAGKMMTIWSDGTNVTQQNTHLNSPSFTTPTLGTPASGTLTNATGLPVATGISGLGTGVATFLATPSSANLAAAVTGETGSGALVFATSPTLVTPALGTPSSGVLTSCTGLPMTTGVTGTLPVANGGTGVTTSTGSGNNVLSTSPTLVTPILGTPTSVTLTNATDLPIVAGTTGTLSVARGGTGVTTSTGTGSTVLSVSPALTGTPTAPTAAAGTSTTQIATTAFLATMYPVGAIYSSTVSTNPGTLFGFGTWVAYAAGRVMIGDGGGFTAGATGGSADAIVVSHTHTATVTDPGHSHTVPAGDGTSGNAIVRNWNTPSNNPSSTAVATTGISVSNSTTGVSGTNANLQPYVVVYIWNRTA